MSTRRATLNTGAMRQDRFASSAVHRPGLLGNLVARRASVVNSLETVSLLWFLQELSHRTGTRTHRAAALFPNWPNGSDNPLGGLDRVAEDLLRLYPSRVSGSVERISKLLAEFCVNPGFTPSRFPTGGKTIEALLEYQEYFSLQVGRPVAETSITKRIFEALDYSLTSRGITLIKGIYRSGKSYSSQAWAMSHSGQIRYVSLSSAPDDTAFYRDICRSLGVAGGLSYKTPQLRDRITETLRSQQIALVIDEADYLFAQTDRPKGPPERINWLMTSVVNQGVPVALIASRNFERALRLLERTSHAWGSEQFRGRIRMTVELPETITEEDLMSIAQSLLPETDGATRLLAVGASQRERGGLGNLETICTRAVHLCTQEGKDVPSFEHVERAVLENFGPIAQENNSDQLSPVRRHTLATPLQPLRETRAALGSIVLTG